MLDHCSDNEEMGAKFRDVGRGWGFFSTEALKEDWRLLQLNCH